MIMSWLLLKRKKLILEDDLVKLGPPFFGRNIEDFERWSFISNGGF